MASPTKRTWLTCVLFLCLAQNAFAFSLLGPFAPWMTPDVGFIHDEAYDIGGPRNLGDEFRWNVPVLTYGFDDEFKNFFGDQGIAAVEEAVAMLNALPPASQIDLSSASLNSLRINLIAQNENLIDLKSFALISLLEQIGLANSTRFSWVATSTDVPVNAGETDGPFASIIRRNFDASGLTNSSYVNSNRYTFTIRQEPSFSLPHFPEINRVAFPEPLSMSLDHPAVTYFFPDPFGSSLGLGQYITGLTRDDLGAIKYLLDTNNVNFEPLLSTITDSWGSNNFVNIAPRPGVNHLTFQRYDPGSRPITNSFIDSYFTDGELKTQNLQRAIQTPDILFTAANHPRQPKYPATIRRRPPNFSHQNATGSGILEPEIVISFHKFGDVNREPLETIGEESFDYLWSSFGPRTRNPPIFPVGPAYQGGRTLSVRAIDGTNSAPAVEWKLRLIAGVQYSIENSADLKTWSNVTNITALPIHTLTNSATSDTSTMFWRARRFSGQ